MVPPAVLEAAKAAVNVSRSFVSGHRGVGADEHEQRLALAGRRLGDSRPGDGEQAERQKAKSCCTRPSA